MKHIYIIRHGQTAFNVQRIVQGQGVDSQLDETGQAQGLAFFEKYHHIPFQTVLTSTLQRTIQTVQPFINKGITHEKMNHLNEIAWGIYEGKPSTPELHANYTGLIQRWGQGLLDEKIELGESANDIAARLYPFVEHLKQRPESHILICTHGGILAFLMALLQNQPPSAMPQYKHRNTGLCYFIFDGNQFLLQLRDSIEHLEQ